MRNPRLALVSSAATAAAIGALLLIVACAFASQALATEPFYPEPVGYVNDFAEVIPAEKARAIDAVSRELDEKTTAELAVATLKTTGGVDIHDYSVELYTKWGLGKLGKDNGVLIVAAIDDRQLWIKTGYGLEGTVPDAFAHAVYRDVLRPAFRSSDYGGGLLSAVEIIATRIADAEGVTLESVGGRRVLPQRAPDGGGKNVARELLVVAAMLIGIVFVLLSRLRGGRGVAGSTFWTMGGFSGGLKGGGFGGGFGGFGGGSCGGGGAGGGW